jgi:asparagine synthase (glutamine-hydrolysing)
VSVCGIGGAIGTIEDSRSVAGFARGCLEANARRGPDHRAERGREVGRWSVHLAHNRLTILDLTPLGNQPMDGARGSTCITFNGEIYNHDALRRELSAKGHTFRSTSDTEVLLAAYAEWDEGFLDRLNGMFAFALLDSARRRLLLVRDRFGVKPVHYHLTPTRLLFASTPRAIAALAGREPDPAFLARGARFGLFDDSSGRSQYREVRSVRPGHLVAVSLEGASLVADERPFYRLDERVAALGPSLAMLDRAGAVAGCRERLLDSVSLRLRADVPVAVSLSGGIDSATLAALASEQHRGLVGFTFGHPDHPDTEGPMAARIAEGLGMKIEFVWPGTAEMIRYFWECLEMQDAPFATGSIVAQYAVYQAVHAAGVKVLLGGQGGDEVFMGYRKYLAWRWLGALRRRAPMAALSSGADLARALWAERSRWRTYLGAARRHRGGGDGGSLLVVAEDPASPYASPAGDALAARQIADITSGGLPTLLRYEDRNSAESSVESRLPYLDYRLAEWAVAAPVDTKLVDGYGKWMLRQVARDRLPRDLLEGRGKRGFDVRVDPWLTAGLGRAMRADIAGRWSWIAGFFAPGTRPDEAFSDRALGAQPQRFADAVTALWIGRCVA